MRARTLLFFLFVSFFLIFTSSRDVFAGTELLRISEVQLSGGEGKTDNDFVEIFNSSTQDVSLDGWRLSKKTESGKEYSLRVFPNGMHIAAGKFFVWANSKDGFSGSLSADVASTATIAEDNTILLCHDVCIDADNVVDKIGIGSKSYEYETSPAFVPMGGRSVARKFNGGTIIDADDNASDFVLNCTPSPGHQDVSICKDKESETKQNWNGQSTVRFNEFLANPSGDERQEEFIELYNFGETDADLSGWTIHDASKTGSFIFLDKRIVAAKGFVAVRRSEFSFSLNNGKESLSLIAPDNSVVDVVTYDSAKEDVSWAHDGFAWRMTKHLTPGAENVFDDLPNASRIHVPKKVFSDVSAEFSVRSKYNVRWDFGDGHRSYKKKTRHTFSKEGEYVVQLRLSGESEDVVQMFTITVKKFPKYAVRIVEFSPNPKGKDSEGEYIVVENRSKKRVSLEGWSIATGSKSGKLVNHPLRETIVLKKGEKKRITRSESLFTLGNKVGFVELRYPNGKVAQKVRYEKAEGVSDDETYRKEKGKRWSWVASYDGAESLEETVKSEAYTITSNVLDDGSKPMNTIAQDSNTENFISVSSARIIGGSGEFEKKTRTVFLESKADTKYSAIFSDAIVLNESFKQSLSFSFSAKTNEHVWNAGGSYCFTISCVDAYAQSVAENQMVYRVRNAAGSVFRAFAFMK